MVSIDECKHERVVENSHESVCSTCGMVLASMSLEDPMEGKSTTNLYERHSIGGRDLLPKMDASIALKRYFHNNVGDDDTIKNSRTLSKFSNTCQKLNMEKSVSEFALLLFRRGKKKMGARDHPLVAVWAIYNSCRSFGVPISEDEMMVAVLFEFNRKYLPDMTKILYKMMGVEKPDIDPARAEEYHFKLVLRDMIGGEEYKKSDYNHNYNLAWSIYKSGSRDGSYRTRARDAINAVFGARL